MTTQVNDYAIPFKATFQVGRLVRAFTRHDDVESRLRSARATLLADGPVAAYEAMRFGDARIKFMGPAFFTKFLYFTGYQDPGYDQALRPLILDNRVAKSLLRWDPAGDWATVGWGSSAYDSYLRIAHEQEKLSPEQAEFVLFAAKGDQLAPPAGWSWPER